MDVLSFRLSPIERKDAFLSALLILRILHLVPVLVIIIMKLVILFNIMYIGNIWEAAFVISV
jgi:hypothetical protein